MHHSGVFEMKNSQLFMPDGTLDDSDKAEAFIKRLEKEIKVLRSSIQNKDLRLGY
jgi:hypothetical protein